MKRLSILLLMGFASACLARTGNENGGGGASVVCRNADKSIISAETLDLYEGRNIYGLNIAEPGGDIPSIIEELKMRLRNSLEQPEIHLFPLIDRVQSILKFTGQDAVLTPIDDVLPIALPANCAIEQLANYVDDDLLVVQKTIWDALSNAQRAALILHEAIYRLERYSGAKSSRRTRRIVASIFSDSKFESVTAELPAGAKLCTAHNGNKTTYRFYYYPSHKNMTGLQFTLFKGHSVFSRKISTIPITLPWSKYYQNNNPCDFDKFCNFSGGDTLSNFEGHDFVTIGRQWNSDSDYSLWFYILDENGLNYIDCRI